MNNDPEIIIICWFDAQQTFIVIINVEKRCLIFWKQEYFFSGFFDEKNCSKDN